MSKEQSSRKLNSRRFRISLFLTIFLIWGEARVSEYHEDSKKTIEDKVKDSNHIVVVSSGQPQSILSKEVRFSKETHFAKKSESFYREYTQVYKVTEVLKSDKIKPGDLHVWEAPIYGEASVRAEHERNESESPVVVKYKPKHKPDPNKSRILFLRDSYEENQPNLIFNDFEGIDGRTEIEKLIKANLKK